MQDFESAIKDLDITLFSRIESQSTDPDKQSLLAVQSAVREVRDSYVYLEIGSHIGGSIQPHLLDDRCTRIYSIDKRPSVQPDARGVDFHYLNNSTERMMENLRQLDPVAADKVVTFDGDTENLSPSAIDRAPQLCLIDGEHTDEAMRKDFDFCRKVLDERGGAILFHDADITYNGIFDCVRGLQDQGVEFRAYNLPNVLFVVELGDHKLYDHPPILKRLINNHEGYLVGLRNNDGYRRFANRFPFRLMRNAMYRLRNYNVSN